MYIITPCPHCGQTAFHFVTLHCIETTEFCDFDSASRYAVEYIQVKETVSEAELLSQIFRTIRDFVKDGIEVKELYQILKTQYGIAAVYCQDLIQKIKVELDMYCPDRQHLYFVTA